MKDTEQDEVVMACVPEDHEHTPESTLQLADCGHLVWLSPSGASARDRHAATLKCLPCLGGMLGLENGYDVTGSGIVPIEVEERMKNGTEDDRLLVQTLRRIGIKFESDGAP